MRRTALAGWLSASLLAVLALPGSALAAHPLQWSITPKNLGQPKGATSYTLSNDTGGALRYGTRPVGINLTWGSAPVQWQFRRNTGANNIRDHRTITATETVALYNTVSRQFLAYGSRTFGIDLVWSATPRFQWKVYEGQSNAPGSTGNVRSKLYNTAAGSYLVYGSQRFGINLVWQRGTYTTPPPNQPSS